MKDRKKTINELAERIKAKENPGYLRIWSFKDGKPYLEEESLYSDELFKINILESGRGNLPIVGESDHNTMTSETKEYKIPNWKAFDLEAIANEPETRQRLTNLKITSEL